MTTYTFNGATVLAPVTVISEEPALSSTTLNLSTLRTSRGVQRWIVSFGLTPIENGEEDLLVGSVVDPHTNKTMVMPQLYNVIRGATATGAVTTSTSAVAGDRSISVTVTGLIPKGSFINFANHAKMYMVTADRDGAGVLSFYPGLTEDVGSAVSVRHPKGTLSTQLTYLEDEANLMGVTYVDGKLVSLDTVQLLEQIV